MRELQNVLRFILFWTSPSGFDRDPREMYERNNPFVLQIILKYENPSKIIINDKFSLVLPRSIFPSLLNTFAQAVDSKSDYAKQYQQHL